MHIILLSGGGGKRLWPLSGNLNSKQFLQLLPAPAGGLESMLQRMVRQMDEAQLGAHIVIAANAAQQSLIAAQLGSRAEVVAEPERRDTFPAIALSAAYLADCCHAAPDEPVVVMPSDTYTEAAYFATVARMARAVEGDVAQMVLMGIKPTEPSPKFGYMVPAATPRAGEPFPVSRFVEKPDATTAGQLLARGAMWNGGVFAFRLELVLQIVRQQLGTCAYAEVKQRYGELTKTSFDYAVVERAERVAAVPYEGAWKDLGTWDVLSQELPPQVGRVLTQGCHGTTAINRLKQPLVVLGADNLIVVATDDGILVAPKAATTALKDVVSKLDDLP